MPTKQTACPCDEFTSAARGRFIEKIGDDHYLASRESFGGNMRGIQYGPKIAFCPFCGGSLTKPTELPPARIAR